MRTVLLDEIVHTDYGIFDLIWGDTFGFDGNYDTYFADQVNGLAGAAEPNGLFLNVARRSGGSSLVIELWDTEPPDAGREWQDVVEVSVHIRGGSQPHWYSWAGESSGELAIPGGGYRVRYSGRDRDRGQADEFAAGVVDFYLVQFWPAPPAPDAVVRCESEDGRYWHREIGGRR